MMLLVLLFLHILTKRGYPLRGYVFRQWLIRRERISVEEHISKIHIGGLHCRHIGVQNKRKFVHIVCMKMEVTFLYTNVAAMTSHANHQLI